MSYFHEISDISNCVCQTCDGPEPMDEGEPSTSPAPASLSPTDQRARNRESEAIRTKAADGRFYGATKTNVVLHAAMTTHREMGNDNAAKIHKMLMEDPTCMDDYFKPKASVKKLPLTAAVALLVHHVSSHSNPF